MLTSHLQHGLLPARHQLSLSTVAMRTPTTNNITRSCSLAQTRNHWSWRSPGDFSSHIDPMFYRFNRYRSLKTRAKQIDKLRRRSRWDWDAAQRPFFNAKHIRFASHFGGPKYHPRKLDGDKQRGNRQDFAEEDGSELSENEKKWKKEMERMRTRIEQDPYEAVFGKRFQPFWSPLLNPLLRWTGEESGLRTDSPTVTKATITWSKKEPESTSVEVPAKKENKDKKDRDLDTDTPNGQLTNYSYTASTAWDSKTSKTRGKEWDSISGMTKGFEYDPISNRMRQIQISPSSNPSLSSNLQSESKSTCENPTPLSQKEPRMSIEVPTTTMDDTGKTSLYSPYLLTTTHAATPAKTSAITKAQESDLDLLTAEDVRASMRGRQERAHFSTSSGASKSVNLQPAIQRMQTKELLEPEEPDDSAAHESTGDCIQPTNIPRGWDQQSELLQATRILRTHREAADEHARVPADNDPTYTPVELKPPTVYMDGRKVEENGRVIDEHQRTPADNDLTLNRSMRFKRPIVSTKGREVEENRHEVDFDELTRTSLDSDSAMDRSYSKSKPSSVYMNRSKVEENAVKIPRLSESRTGHHRSANDAAVSDQQSKYQRKVDELKRQLDLSYEQSTINSEMHVDRIRELERALQKARDNSAGKATGPEYIQAEGDFDIAVSKFANNSSKWYKLPTHQATVKNKVTPSTHSRSARSSSVCPRDTVMDDALAKTEREYGITYNGATKKDTADLLKDMAEKDRQMCESSAGRNPFPDPHSAKVDKEVAEKYKYKPEDTTRLLSDYAEKDRQIGESCAGRNPFPDPHSIKVDKEMAEESSHKPQDTKQLLADYAEQDRQIREKRAGRNPFPDPLSIKVDREMAEKYKYKPEDTTKLLEADAQREKEWASYIAQKKSGASQGIDELPEEAAKPAIQWAEPPVYKILAYDSGNDMFSTATTSSNFTTHETPISIQDALSELYQPARFVPHFAELQKQGYQVIYGTKDLLLFRKRRQVEASHVDHGLFKHSDTQAEPLTSLVEPISFDDTGSSIVTPSYVSPGCPNHRGRVIAREENLNQSVRGILDETKKLNETKQNPRVYREERVFTGRKKGGRHRSELTAEEIELLRKLKGNGSGWASRILWALGVGVGASAVAYGVGSAVERKEIRDRERWEDALEGKYKRRST